MKKRSLEAPHGPPALQVRWAWGAAKAPRVAVSTNMPSMQEHSAEQVLAGRLRFQAEACGRLGSLLYERLLHAAAADVEGSGPVSEVLQGHEADPASSALALRLMGAVNRLVLEGRAPELAAAYADPRGDSDAWHAFRKVLERDAPAVRSMMDLPVQTNEVGRCAALLPGFLTVASETGLPLRLLEVGASAGLNLHWDRYRFLAGDFAWGPARSPVQIDFALDEGERMPVMGQAAVVERRGCDVDPLDPTTPEGRRVLLAYVWPDQQMRVERMQTALELAAEEPVTIDREGAASWVEAQLADRHPNEATVVFHSIVIQYLDEDERAAFYEHIADAGEQASADAPLAWLRMEPAGEWADVRLTIWPGGEERHLARAGYHGSPVSLL